MEPIYALLFLGLGLLVGGLSAWLVAKYRFALQGYDPEWLSKNYVERAVFEHVESRLQEATERLERKETELQETRSALAAREQTLQHLQEKLDGQEAEFERLRRESHLEFERVANRLLEEKSRRFSSQNAEKLTEILQPLREKIREFEQDLHRRFSEESKERISLKKEIEQLHQLNRRLSEDAQNLVSALKGDSKMQGDWGEFRLELLLEKAGLQKGIHFEAQSTHKNTDGRTLRPDFIVHLPRGRHLIIDAKVSLVAFERYASEEDPHKREQHLKAHLQSLRQHIRSLSAKNYPQLDGLNSPDYLLLFVPLEPAFSLAILHDPALFHEALERNIVLVTTSTLLATLRTVAFIWKQDRQQRNVLEIARQSGLLYDKFVNFVKDLQTVGERLDGAQQAYHDAMNKLKNSPRFGTTLIGRAERLRKLGAKTSKQLPSDWLPAAEEE
ncbi:MAG: DNA recombination protein RmuC [Bacteroidetes bacterium]|nr:MAG: DNA recombination protein RmuC [Bacteroidota bacterium]